MGAPGGPWLRSTVEAPRRTCSACPPLHRRATNKRCCTRFCCSPQPRRAGHGKLRRTGTAVHRVARDRHDRTAVRRGPAPRAPPAPTASFGRPPEYDEQLDLSRAQFDFLSLKSFRRDALLQYDATNQSEPLRIILSFLGILFCLCLPTLNSEAGLENGLVTDAIAVAGACGSGFLFVTDRAARSARIERISREYAMGDLRALSRACATRRSATFAASSASWRCAARATWSTPRSSRRTRTATASRRRASRWCPSTRRATASPPPAARRTIFCGRRPTCRRGAATSTARSRRATSTGRRARGWRSTSRGGARGRPSGCRGGMSSWAPRCSRRTAAASNPSSRSARR